MTRDQLQLSRTFPRESRSKISNQMISNDQRSATTDSANGTQDATNETWGVRNFEGRGVGVLVEWQNKARRTECGRHGEANMGNYGKSPQNT